MNKRLRKKKHVGEFIEYGYQLVIGVNTIDAEPFNKLVDSFIDAGFSVGGGGRHNKLFFFVMRKNKRRSCSCTEADKETINKLLSAMPEYVTTFKISNLLNAWQSPSDEAMEVE